MDISSHECSFIEGGDILIDNGIIVDVGQNIDYAPKRTDDVIDASDCFVFPGFIDAHSQVGIALDGIATCLCCQTLLRPISL
jgi:imidazolonepropionase-like amidohydrolase